MYSIRLKTFNFSRLLSNLQPKKNAHLPCIGSILLVKAQTKGDDNTEGQDCLNRLIACEDAVFNSDDICRGVSDWHYCAENIQCGKATENELAFATTFAEILSCTIS
ncbi:hypothetical protein PoB_001411900 [Plakobranchus ocellatus]|uniref:Uncharacterized protein n=1 Tax=Plakobranchus ocellatus TaxID=259542 RepID=A0AAV3YX45_9GAST|nr:hypothetical protein PoB_001411900 [Plakobranchus ocellatus]